ncbi:hypothetical protein POM88_037696 [Heracleum sosnowskyi]|uniref:Uncharacterized protein n=1 Tax=Heracleum sosnowskyi TaxID=360622 RepID=A0AAD8HQL0_9APIA|nr:hypothetical protein POM88_037696 [Heracleum sosnowskyi]
MKYAIQHNVQNLYVDKFDWDVPILESKSLKILNLAMKFHRRGFEFMDDWYLPALTSLNLTELTGDRPMLPISCFIGMPALTNLCLEGFGLPPSLSLPGLTKLHLKGGELPSKTVWDLPALTSLVLDEVKTPSTNIAEFLSALVSLQDLKLLRCFENNQIFLISSPQLLHLELRTTNSENDTWIPSIMVFAPKLLNVTTVGIFSITCCNSKLENVQVIFQGGFKDKKTIPWGMLKQYYCQLMFMFRGLDSARILTLDSDTIEALSAIVDLLQCSFSPFHNLKCVKLPQGYKESNICGTVKSYLLGGSAGATMVTTLRQNDVIPKITLVLPTTVDAQTTPEAP